MAKFPVVIERIELLLHSYDQRMKTLHKESYRPLARLKVRAHHMIKILGFWGPVMLTAAWNVCNPCFFPSQLVDRIYETIQTELFNLLERVASYEDAKKKKVYGDIVSWNHFLQPDAKLQIILLSCVPLMGRS